MKLTLGARRLAERAPRPDVRHRREPGSSTARTRSSAARRERAGSGNHLWVADTENHALRADRSRQRESRRRWPAPASSGGARRTSAIPESSAAALAMGRGGARQGRLSSRWPGAHQLWVYADGRVGSVRRVGPRGSRRRRGRRGRARATERARSLGPLPLLRRQRGLEHPALRPPGAQASAPSSARACSTSATSTARRMRCGSNTRST